MSGDPLGERKIVERANSGRTGAEAVVVVPVGLVPEDIAAFPVVRIGGGV